MFSRRPSESSTRSRSAASATASRLAYKIARAVPPSRRDAFIRLGKASRDLLTGRDSPLVVADQAPAAPTFDQDERPILGYRYPEVADNWKAPPPVTHSGQAVRSIYSTGGSVDRFDVELLEKLNQEYAAKPLVESPPSYDAQSLATNAQRRLNWVHRMVNLRGMRTLEIGCGNGQEVWSAAHNYGADAWGVDVTEYGPWSALADDRAHLVLADLAQENPFEPDFFDRVISFTVWEHVLHPYRMLAETYNVLKPGGLAWIRANLYAGPMASHRYRDIYFPWPHLLFTDEVVRDWDVRSGRSPVGLAWVNRLSWLHYKHYIAKVGFRIRHLSFTETPIDEDFYHRFEDILGRYPRWDLTKDYFLVVLEKPATES